MTAKEAAELIGCSVNQVRVLCRKRLLRRSIRPIPGGYYYDIDPQSVLAYRATPQKQGYPRGVKRRNHEEE